MNRLAKFLEENYPEAVAKLRQFEDELRKDRWDSIAISQKQAIDICKEPNLVGISYSGTCRKSTPYRPAGSIS